MAIRRRRKKLTSLVSRLDERVRSVELRPINLLTSDQVDAAVQIGEAAAQPTNVVSGTAPNEFRKVQDAYYYSKTLTGGSEDRVSIYLESDLNLEVGDTLEVSGIHGTNDTDIDVSGTFEVKFTDTPPWDDRASWKHDPEQDQLPGVTITNEYSVKPDTLGPSTWGNAARRLQTKRLVDTFSITDTTVTLTMNAVHKFKVGDVVFVDIFAEDSRAYGADGLFEITAVTSNTIEYELVAGVDTPTGDITPSADVYVFPVARNFIPVGSTWADSSTNKIYVWDGIRWVDYSAVDIEADGDPPSAPTNLSISSEITFFQTATPVVEVSVSWTAPTTSESGDPLTDLLGYTIKYRRNSSEPWKVQDLPFTDTSYTFSAAADFQPGTSYDFEVYAYDSGNLYSEALTGSHTTESAPATNIVGIRPTPFDSKIYLGTVTLTWDGAVEDTSGNPQTKPDGLVFLDIHVSTTDGFTPSASTLITSISAVAGNKYVYADVEYGTTYYFKGVLRDASGTSSLPSTQISALTQSLVDANRIAGIISAANITPGTMVTGEKIVGLSITGELIEALEINADLIEANTINASHIDAASISAELIDSDSFRTASTGARVEFNSSGIYGYNSSNGVTFRVLASNGSVFIANGVQIGGYATDGELSAVNTTATSAQSTANSAQSTANNAVTIANGKITIGNAASDVNNNPTTIDGSKITSGTLVITGTDLSADSLSTFIANGGRLSTTSGTPGSEPNPKVVVTDRGIFGFDASASPIFRLYGDSGDSNAGKFFTAGPIVSGGSITGSTITAAGGVIRSSSSFPRVELESDVFNSVRFRFTSSSEAYFEHLSGAIIARGGFAVAGITAGTSTSYYVVSEPFTGLLVRGGIYSSSDARLKDNVKELPLGLEFISSLNPVTFNWKKDSSNKLHTGLIAQEVLENINSKYPEYNDYFVKKEPSDKIEGDDSAYGIKYERFIPSLINSIKELSAQVTDLKKEVEYLKTKDKNADS